jgi:ribose-phosphate pyrophosphokinase
MASSMTPVIYTFPSYQEQGKQLANSLNLPSFDIKVHHFPDKESLVTLPPQKNEHVIFCLSLNYPNNKLIELLLAAKTARQQGIKRLSLVAPYLCYMRQDKSFQSEEAISQQIIGQWLSELFDDLITIDPHLHRVTSLDMVIPDTNNIILTAAPLLGEFVKSLKKDILLMGPDEESLQWVKQVAAVSNSTYAVATKIRHSDTHVSIQLPEMNFQNQYVILVDDVISTGNTVAQTAMQLYAAGVSQVDVLVTHALFSKDAMDTLKKENIKNIWSSDSIPHKTNSIPLANLLAEKIKTIF